MSVSIRRLDASQFAEADRVLQAAFARDTSFEPVLDLQLQVEPGGLWGAFDDRRLVGTACCVDYRQLAYIGLMSVHPSAQGGGIGHQLLTHVLRWIEERGCPIAMLDATEAGAKLYKQFDFVEDSTARVFEQAAPPPEVRSGLRVAPADANDLESIAAFDAPLFGANRSKLLQAVWPAFCHRTFVARDDRGQVAGYAVVRDPLIGPWAAQSVAVAEALLAAALQLKFEHPPQAPVPRSNALCEELLKRFGFVERRTLRHMRRGGSGPPGEPEKLFGQCTFAHG